MPYAVGGTRNFGDEPYSLGSWHFALVRDTRTNTIMMLAERATAAPKSQQLYSDPGNGR